MIVLISLAFLITLYFTVYYAVKNAINDSEIGNYFAMKNGIRKKVNISAKEEINNNQ